MVNKVRMDIRTVSVTVSLIKIQLLMILYFLGVGPVLGGYV